MSWSICSIREVYLTLYIHIISGDVPVQGEQTRWISLKNTERRMGYNVSKGNQVSPSGDGAPSHDPTSSILSFVGSRLKQNNGRSTKINMWTTKRKLDQQAMGASNKDNNKRF